MGGAACAGNRHGRTRSGKLDSREYQICFELAQKFGRLTSFTELPKDHTGSGDIGFNVIAEARRRTRGGTLKRDARCLRVNYDSGLRERYDKPRRVLKPGRSIRAADSSGGLPKGGHENTWNADTACNAIAAAARKSSKPVMRSGGTTGCGCGRGRYVGGTTPSRARSAGGSTGARSGTNRKPITARKAAHKRRNNTESSQGKTMTTIDTNSPHREKFKCRLRRATATPGQESRIRAGQRQTLESGHEPNVEIFQGEWGGWMVSWSKGAVGPLESSQYAQAIVQAMRGEATTT